MFKLNIPPHTKTQTRTTKGNDVLFLKALTVWINKPHVINRRLCGSKLLRIFRCQSKNEAEKTVEELGKGSVSDLRNSTLSTDSEHNFTDLSEEPEPFTVIVRELIPKSEFFPTLYEAIVFDKDRVNVSFLPLDQTKEGNGHAIAPTIELPYSISFRKIDGDFPVWAQVNEIILSWSSENNDAETERCQVSSQWLSSVLLEKLASWSQVNDISTSVTSLLLVPVDKYKDTYVRLKNTYGRDLVKNWTESTDPEKFVYEDVAIASYLLLIWEEDRRRKGLTKKQSFVDLGCGNGLLVYILSKEGHRGLGIDMRKRKIWDTFGPGVDLQEQTVSPSSEHLFPDYDWLIGNHSDELTPWIPVIAARSSSSCCFFVLPCCPHDFVGKFADCKKGQSRYATYMDYVKQVVDYSGFKPEMDTLRIPSTKRICLIGRERSYKPKDEMEADIRRQAFIDKRTLYQNRNKKINSADLDSVQDKSSNSGATSTTSGESQSHRDSLIESKGADGINLNSQSEPASGQVNHGTAAVSNRSNSEENQISKKRKFSSSVSDQEPDVVKKLGPDRSLPESERSEVKSWASDFKPRNETGVRNCQSVAEETKLKIVTSVFQHVLDADQNQKAELSEGKSWRKGGAVSLPEIVGLFDSATLQELKSECGGLQTLLRNHSHVFQVSGGRVMLRDFSVADPWKGCNPHKKKGHHRGKPGSKGEGGGGGGGPQQSDSYKTTLCWFYERHPDGCPRSSSECGFAHSSAELRAKPTRRKHTSKNT